jgi:hypothetical protein
MKKRSLATLTVVGVVGVLGVTAPVGFASHPPINRVCFETPSTANTGSPGPALLSMLGVLRRPQKPSDDLELSSLPHIGEGVYVNYIRLARVVAGTSYYLIPVAKPHCSEPEELLLNERSSSYLGSSYGGATAAHIAQGKLFSSSGKGPTAVVAGVVPDHVAKVSVSYAKSGHLHAVTITTKPVENVFVATVPRESPAASVPKSVVWRSAKGKVIKTIHG